MPFRWGSLKKTVLPALVAVVVLGSAAFVWNGFFPSDHTPSDHTPSNHTMIPDDSSGPRLDIRSSQPAGFSPKIRVSLMSAPVLKVRVAINGPYEIRPVGSKRILGRGNRLETSAIAATSIGIRIGKINFPSSRLEIVPKRRTSVIRMGNHKYRGTLRLFRREGGKLLAVNVVSFDDYLASVIDSEMPAAFPDEARRVQAIAARTYALYHMRKSPTGSLFDLYASVRSQRYLGFEYQDRSGRWLAGESSASRRIVRETAGLVVTDRGRLFCTYYSAVCGGQTTKGSSIFSDVSSTLRSVPCNWCKEARYYRWKTSLSKKEFTKSLKPYFKSVGKRSVRVTSVKRVSRAVAGGDSLFEVSDGRHRHRVSALVLRRWLPQAVLYSSHFSIDDQGKELVFEGRGHGHGVGMCQWGARGQALAGRSAQDILLYYYPGSKVIRIEP